MYEFEEIEADGTTRRSEAEVEIEPAEERGEAWVVASTFAQGDLRTFDRVRYTDQGAWLLSRDIPRVNVRSDGQRTLFHKPCTYDPPKLLYPLPVVEGDQYDVEGKCRFEDGDEERYDETVTVGETHVRRVGDRSFTCTDITRTFERLPWRSETRCLSVDLRVNLEMRTENSGATVRGALVQYPPG